MTDRFFIECLKLIIYMAVAVGLCIYFNLPHWSAFLAVVVALVFHSLTLGRGPRR